MFTDADATTLGTIVEGAYMVLFAIYLVLRGRKGRMIDGPMTLAQILLFGLCTVADAEHHNAASKADLGTSVIFSLIDYLAQMILLYRCWIIWDRRWVVVAVPGFLALVSLGGEFVLVGLVNAIFMGGDADELIPRITPTGIAAFSISLAINALTTSLIVTRIVIISREVRPVLGPDFPRSLRVVTAMLIESGLLVFVSQLLYVVLFAIRHPSHSFVAGPITQIYGITPTLLNIRVVMGATYDKTTQKRSSLQFADSERVTQTTGTGVTNSSTSGIHTRRVNIELDDVDISETGDGKTEKSA